MNVYVLQATDPYESNSWVVGVFSSLEFAKSAADKSARYDSDQPWHSATDGSEYWRATSCIFRCTINDPDLLPETTS